MTAKFHKTGLQPPSASHMYWCPGCDCAHGVHADLWQVDEATVTISPSVLAQGRIRCHSFVTLARIEFLSDSEHHLAGQTVDVPDWPFEEES